MQNTKQQKRKTFLLQNNDAFKSNMMKGLLEKITLNRNVCQEKLKCAAFKKKTRNKKRGK